VTSLSEERVQEIKDSFARQGLMQTFEASLTHIALGHIEIAMPHRPAITQQHGFFHGGVMGALADVACGYAALSTVAPGQAGLTAEYKINLLSPADGDTLIAVGQVIKAGKTLIVAEADVWIEKQGVRKKCAVMLMTLCVVKHLGSL
jgi:uncharacterized protein (TIGR00369 family)